MKTSALVSIVVVAIIVVGGAYWLSQQNSSQPASEGTQTSGEMPQMPMTEQSAPTAPQQASDQSATQAVPPSASQTPPASRVSATIANFAFSPATITVKKGDTITWTNSDSAPHTVTSDTGAFASQTLAQGESYSHTFNTAGTFPYHCAIHPMMHGTVVVTE